MNKAKRRSYSPEFKEQAIELSQLRGRVTEVAEELGIRADLLRKWIYRKRSQDVDGHLSNRTGTVLSEEQKELVRLKRELEQVRMERDILKKAVTIFSTPPVGHSR